MNENIKLLSSYDIVLNLQMENILNSHPIHHASPVYRRLNIPTINRDFRNIYALENDFNYVSTHPGEYRELYATGSGFQTKWYFYNSPQHHKLYMIWISEHTHGFRDDLERIQIIPSY